MDKIDWRLTNQEKYLKGLSFKRKKYNGENHSHCEFCWAKFGYNECDLVDGYCSENEKYWICEKCFKDFEKIFSFKII